VSKAVINRGIEICIQCSPESSPIAISFSISGGCSSTSSSHQLFAIPSWVVRLHYISPLLAPSIGCVSSSISHSTTINDNQYRINTKLTFLKGELRRATVVCTCYSSIYRMELRRLLFLASSTHRYSLFDYTFYRTRKLYYPSLT